MKDKHKRILIFNVNWVGDVLFSTALIRNVRRNFPDSFIACAIPGRCYPVLKGNPHLDEIIIFDEKERHKSTLSKMKFVQSLRARRFDTVFLLHRSFSRALICRLAGIKERIGYYTRKRGFLLTKGIKPLPKDASHRIDHYLHIIEQAGLRVEDRYTEFFFDEAEAKYVEAFLEKNGIGKDDFTVAINPGGNWLPKRWPKEHWAILSDRLIEEFNAKVVITGSALDMPLAREIKDLMKEKPVFACGVFNLKQFGAFAKKADLVITADTGPLHIANAAGAKKIIALFGPTSPAITGPYPGKNAVIIQKDTDCKIPCYTVSCKDNRCMKAITPEDVIAQVRRITNKPG